jgi:hypothetical protein
MKVRLTIVIIAATVLAASCSPIYVEHSFADYADFSQYKTYSWLPLPKSDLIVQGPRGESERAKQIRAAIDRELTAKGLQQVDDEGDLRVIYYVGSDHMTEIQQTYYNTGTSTRVTQIKEGSLVIQLLDERSVVMWEGTAENAKRADASMEEIRATIDKAVEKLFRNYPPK